MNCKSWNHGIFILLVVVIESYSCGDGAFKKVEIDSIPYYKKPRDKVVFGYLNKSDSLYVVIQLSKKVLIKINGKKKVWIDRNIYELIKKIIKRSSKAGWIGCPSFTLVNDSSINNQKDREIFKQDIDLDNAD